jgi:tetratricopeptide (TPR) repeat protein
LLVAAFALAWSLLEPAGQTLSAEPDETAAARAQRHFEAEQWDEAIEALIEAYAEDPDPAYLYARAQAERMRGNCKAAIELYRRFLAGDPSPKQRADTERHIRLCEEILFQREVEVSPTPPPAEPPPPPAPVPERRPRRDAVGPALLGSGLVAAAAGMTIAIVGDTARRRAPDAATEDAYEDDGRRGTILLATGVSIATVGGALIAGAIARFAIISRRRRGAVALGPAVGVSVRGRF